MSPFPPVRSPVDADAPLTNFSRCHEGITAQLREAAGLPELIAQMARGRRVAAATVRMFQEAVLPHHAEEESELFPAVVRSALPGEEAQQAAAMVARLTAEHRELERLWTQVAPAVKAAARGDAVEMDAARLADLVARYLDHARFEEDVFLPMSERILSRNGNHMAALGLALHLRHAPQIPGYI